MAPYRELIGALLYLAIATRPDISHTVAKLAQFSSHPEEQHWKTAKHVLRYLKGTKDLGLGYRRTNGISVTGMSDAEWGGCPMERKSFSGYVFFLGKAAIFWSSQKQQTMALSSTEAEYMGLTEAAKEAAYLRGLLIELKLMPSASIVLYVDNQRAKCLAEYPVHHKRTKHIDIRYHYIRDVINREEVILEHLPMEDMVVDIFTKALTGVRHKKMVDALGLKLIGSRMS